MMQRAREGASQLRRNQQVGHRFDTPCARGELGVVEKAEWGAVVRVRRIQEMGEFKTALQVDIRGLVSGLGDLVSGKQDWKSGEGKLISQLGRLRHIAERAEHVFTWHANIAVTLVVPVRCNSSMQRWQHAQQRPLECS